MSLNTKTTTQTQPLVLQPVSDRIEQTLDPCVVLMKQLVAKHQHLWTEKGGIYSLAQGVVYWKPPPSAYTAMTNVIQDAENTLHCYTLDEGLPELQTALKEKIDRENHLSGCDVIITSGANQAYMNCVLTLMSEGDVCVVFKPYYFNHVMAVQMTRGGENENDNNGDGTSSSSSLLVGPIDEDDGCPSIEWLREQFESDHERRIKMVTVVNPGNPTGVSIPTAKLQAIVDLCRDYGAWVIFDCTYEQFDHSGANTFPILDNNPDDDNKEKGSESDESVQEYGFHCFNDEHVMNIFSFSKGYAMAGFRVGYVAINTTSGRGKDAYEQMVKVQDTIPICTSQISQYAALGALSAGRKWVAEKVKTLDAGREAILNALSPLETTIGGTGAMYCMAKLPDGVDDMEFSEKLVKDFGIAVIPGNFCGFPGWIRVCYSNLPTDECLKAASRLKTGIQDLC